MWSVWKVEHNQQCQWVLTFRGFFWKPAFWPGWLLVPAAFDRCVTSTFLVFYPGCSFRKQSKVVWMSTRQMPTGVCVGFSPTRELCSPSLGSVSKLLPVTVTRVLSARFHRQYSQECRIFYGSPSYFKTSVRKFMVEVVPCFSMLLVIEYPFSLGP